MSEAQKSQETSLKSTEKFCHKLFPWRSLCWTKQYFFAIHSLDLPISRLFSRWAFPISRTKAPNALQLSEAGWTLTLKSFLLTLKHMLFGWTLKKLVKIWANALWGSDFEKSFRKPGRAKKARLEMILEKNNFSDLFSRLECIQFWNDLVLEEDEIFKFLLSVLINISLWEKPPANETC